MARVFTREEFYEMVWSKPLTHLAKELGISDVALHKICKKHDVPNPSLGWWAKKAAGKKVVQTPLPPAKVGVADKVTIAAGDLSRESPMLANVREQARIRASGGDDSSAALPHPIVERTLAKLRNAKPSDIGMVAADGPRLIKCELGASSVDRIAIALPLIVRAASLQGFELIAANGPGEFKSETETVGFSISETIAREKHVLTDAERAKEEAWQRKRDRAARTNSWSDVFLDKPSFPDWDYRLTGHLSLELEHVYVFQGAAPRRTFRDAKTQRLENMASEIAVGIAVLAAAKTDVRLKREAEQHRIEEERLRREQSARIKHIEERRARGLREIFTELDELDKLRRLVSMLSAEMEGGPSLRLSAFLAWAHKQLKKRELRLSAESIENRFAAEGLFGDNDDHDFRASPSLWFR